MAGRTGIGGRARRCSGLTAALIDAGLMPAPRPRTWHGLLAGLTVCDEATHTLAEPDPDVLWLDNRQREEP